MRHSMYKFLRLTTGAYVFADFMPDDLDGSLDHDQMLPASLEAYRSHVASAGLIMVTDKCWKVISQWSLGLAKKMDAADYVYFDAFFGVNHVGD